MRIAVYPGSFNPFTYGHLDILQNAIPLFDKIIVICSSNPNKPQLSQSEDSRCYRISECLKHNNIIGVEVIQSSNLIVDICQEYNAQYIIRGLRDSKDFLDEEKLADANYALNDKIQTIYFRATQKHISSSLVRELLSRGKDVSKFVPIEMRQDIISFESGEIIALV